jgi:GlpG protein
MRQLGALPDRAAAERLAAYLTAQEMLASAEPKGKEWAVWIRDEDHLDRAKAAWEEFRKDPADPKFAGHEQQAEALLREREEKNRRARENTRSAWDLWQRPALERWPATIVLIGLSIAVTLFARFGDRSEEATGDPPRRHFAPVVAWIAFYNPERIPEGFVPKDPFLDIWRGEVWRLVTPIFLHLGVTHLLFNMLWLYRLGSLLEQRRGWWWLLLFTAATGAASNAAEMLMSGAVLLGGFSGVVYALFGYCWMATGLYRDDELQPDQFTTLLMVGWMVLGFTGVLTPVVGNMANWAHLAGLVLGAAIAAVPALFRSRR